MTELQRFNFEGIADVRILDQSGTPWFIAQDICKALGFTRTSDATRYLDADEKGALIMRTPGGRQKVTTISESGLYNLIMRSSKPNARLMKKWVTSVVLPSIRKHGGYVSGQETLSTESQAGTVQAIADHAAWVSKRHAEEKEARYRALKLLNAGRTRRRKRSRPAKPSGDPVRRAMDGE